MPSPYYTGDAVPLEFNVFYKEEAEPVTSATVTIRNGHNLMYDEDDAIVDGNTVTYTVPSSVTEIPGEYAAWFICVFSYGERTHEMIFNILPNPRLI